MDSEGELGQLLVGDSRARPSAAVVRMLERLVEALKVVEGKEVDGGVKTENENA